GPDRAALAQRHRTDAEPCEDGPAAVRHGAGAVMVRTTKTQRTRRDRTEQPGRTSSPSPPIFRDLFVSFVALCSILSFLGCRLAGCRPGARGGGAALPQAPAVRGVRFVGGTAAAAIQFNHTSRAGRRF